MLALILTGSAPSFAANAADTGEKASVYKEAGIELTPSAEIDWEDAPSVEGTSAIIMDAGSGEILYEKNIHDKRDPASITKMLTALVVLETADLDEKVTIAVDADPTGVNINLKKGEVLTVEQLLYAALVESANDAAENLAIAVGGSVENFCKLMNDRAARCGALDTEFSNASGLNTYGQKPHHSTAYDLALIAREAMKNPTFRKMVATTRYTIPATNMSGERKLKSTNVCLYEDKKTVEVNGKKRVFKYEGTTGVKTGYTEIAGQCFCGSVKRGDTELIAISLNSSSSKQRYADVMELWDYGLSKYFTYTAAKANEPIEKFRVWRGEKSHVAVGISDDMDITLNKGFNSDDITLEVIKKDRFIKAPIVKGQILGYLVAYNDEGEAISAAELSAMSGVEKGGILSYIGIADENRTLFIVGIVIALILLILIRMVYVQIKRSRRRRRRARRNRDIKRREREHERNPFDGR